MQQFLNKIIFKLENYKISFLNFILTLLSIAFIRSFCEGICERKRVIGHILTDNHYDSLRHNFNFWSLEWLAMFATLVLIFYIFTRENILKISKILLIFYPIIILPVILDYFIYFPNGSEITYFYTIGEYLNGLLNFFIFNKEIPKASLGVRIEVFLAVILSFFYVYLKKSNLFSAFICALCVYFISISSMAFPVFILLPLLPFLTNPDNFIFNFFSNAQFPFDSESKVSIMIFLFLIFVLSIHLYILNKKTFIKILILLLKEKLLFLNIFLFIFGFFYAAKFKFYSIRFNIFNSNFIGIFILSCILLALFLLILFVFLKNKIQNYLFFILLLLILFLSISISYAVFLTTTFILAIYIILFIKPFFLYNNLILKNILYSILNLTFILLGFASVYEIYAPQNISFSFSAPIFLLLLSNNFMYEINEKKIDLILFIFIIFAYLISGFFFEKEIIFVFSLIISILAIFIFFKKKIYLIYLLLLYLILFLIFI